MSGRDRDRIDFSSLDPSRDPARWERMIESVAARASATARGPTVFDQLAAWWRPALAAAAVFAVAVLGAALLAGSPKPNDPAPATQAEDAALVQWALGDGGGSAWDDLALLGRR